MLKKRTLLAAGIAGLLVAGTIGADGHEGPFAKQIKGRQAVFQVYSYNMGLLSAMAKGKMEYDAQTAIDAAWNLNTASMLKNSTMWPAGSANDENEGTRALPAIWSTYPEITKKAEGLTKASGALVAVAGNGLDALKGAIGDVGAACKACHDDFRAKKK